MSKEKQIDDKDLDRISGAGGIEPAVTHLSDSSGVPDSGSDPDLGKAPGSGGAADHSQDVDNTGTGGGGLQDLGD